MRRFWKKWGQSPLTAPVPYFLHEKAGHSATAAQSYPTLALSCPCASHLTLRIAFARYGKQRERYRLLIEFSKPLSLLKLVRMERELADALGKNVDLCTPMSLSKYFRPDVLREAEPIFESVA